MKKRKVLWLILSAMVMIATVTALAVAFALPAGAASSRYYTHTVANGEATITDVNTSIIGDVTIYHGSLVVVEKPEIRIGDRYLDFGYGFYTTMNEEQAIKWTEKQKNRKGTNIGYVSTYDFDMEKAESELKIIRFDKADKECSSFRRRFFVRRR